MNGNIWLALACLISALTISMTIVIVKKISSDNTVRLCVIMTCIFLSSFVLVANIGNTEINSAILTLLGGTIGYFARAFDEKGSENAENKPK